MLQKPTTGAEVKFDDWRRQGSEVAGHRPGAAAGVDQYEIQFQVFDVLRGEQLLGYRQPATTADFRRSATGWPISSTRSSPASAASSPPALPTSPLSRSQADRARSRAATGSSLPMRMAQNRPGDGGVAASPSCRPPGRPTAGRSPTCPSRRAGRRSTCRTCGRARASASRRARRQRRAGLVAGRADSWRWRSRQDGNLDIYTLDINTQVLTRLTSGSAIDTEPAWSLDGRQIYFTSDATGGPQVYRVAAGGGSAQRVTFEGSYNARPRVAPDGKQLAVVHNDRGNYRIAVVDLARSTTQVLSDGRLDESPSFAPNGEMLIYATREGARGVLATVSSNGRIKTRIPVAEGDVREPAWSPFPPN